MVKVPKELYEYVGTTSKCPICKKEEFVLIDKETKMPLQSLYCPRCDKFESEYRAI
jgi:hypothetical protein